MTLCYLVFIGMCSAQFSRGELARFVYTGCHEKLRPRKLSHTMFISNSQIILSSPVYPCRVRWIQN